MATIHEAMWDFRQKVEEVEEEMGLSEEDELDEDELDELVDPSKWKMKRARVGKRGSMINRPGMGEESEDLAEDEDGEIDEIFQTGRFRMGQTAKQRLSGGRRLAPKKKPETRV